MICLLQNFIVHERWWTWLLEIIPSFSLYRGLYEFSAYAFRAGYTVNLSSEERIDVDVRASDVVWMSSSIPPVRATVRTPCVVQYLLRLQNSGGLTFSNMNDPNNGISVAMGIMAVEWRAVSAARLVFRLRAAIRCGVMIEMTPIWQLLSSYVGILFFFCLITSSLIHIAIDRSYYGGGCARHGRAAEPAFLPGPFPAATRT